MTKLLLTVRHATTYRYARPVAFGQHRLMLRAARLPRHAAGGGRTDAVAAGQHALDARRVRQFGRAGGFLRAGELSQPSPARSTIERYGIEGPVFPIAPEAEFYPFIYSSSDRVDLGRLLEQHYPDPEGVLARWADSFVTARPMRTLDLLTTMNAALKPVIVYTERHEPGTQSPAETLQKKAGACRDFAMTFIEAARYLGFGARFVSGYLVRPRRSTKATPRKRPPPRMPGRRSTCPAPAGSNTTRPTC